MAGRHTAVQSAAARQVLEGVEQWRETRAKRGPMPEALWAAAVSLAQADGVYRTSRLLRVNYEALKGRVERLAHEKKDCQMDRGGFVEVNASQVLGTSCQAPVTVVEMADSRGARMAIRHSGTAPLDVAGVADVFWRRQP
ncbi:MAG: hypothetical protein JRI68_33570 [Deltaproteobacteria bacterium]|nr:hypothetical protein [Deltaproteobacteria bacterium]